MTHIKVPDIKPEIKYIGDGVQTTFNYPFPIFNDSDIKVYFNNNIKSGGYTVLGDGNTNGGILTFTEAPELNVVVTIAREIPLERSSDFTNVGRFSATSLNNEFDYITAGLQQVNNIAKSNLAFPKMERSTINSIPSRSERANKLLSFDGDGNPTVTPISEDGFSLMSSDMFLANGASAVQRKMLDKNKDFVSVKDFGAKGDGITDDTNSIKNALRESSSVFFPEGIYNISSSLEVKYGQFIFGLGNNSIISAINNSFDVINVTSGMSNIHDIKIINGNAGIKLYGKDSPCVQNIIENVIIESAEMGIVLDGYNSKSNPCYWNNFNNILISKPKTHGVLLTLTGNGDTPNANRFSKVRVYSHGEDTQGYGVFIQNGKYHNTFIDLEVNIDDAANGCIRLSEVEETLLMNVYTETIGAVDNIILDEDSQNTSIINHLSMSAGGAIVDSSGGSYSAINAGYPEKNYLRRTESDDFKAKLMRYEVTFIDYSTSAIHNIDLSTSFYLVSSFNGSVNMVLPEASMDNYGVEITIKKQDLSKNPVIITEKNGTGPDNREIKLSARYDFITVVSNGANWWIKAANAFPRSDQYYDGIAKVKPSLSSPLCLVSAYSGNVEVELPPADNINAIGQTLIIKKTDVTNNIVTITENGGAGPDNSNKVLNNQYDFITVMSNGAQWYVVG
ncbi:MAG: hypothetical protein OIF36_03100 [Alphaproteobacteria bacterium]|nr:hypothetical protein [Alphaproteobacteria bacterium]